MPIIHTMPVNGPLWPTSCICSLTLRTSVFQHKLNHIIPSKLLKTKKNAHTHTQLIDGQSMTDNSNLILEFDLQP